MKLNYKDLKNAPAWAAANIELPPYDPETLAARTQADPRWAHFGIGNIFRIFVGGIADRLLREGAMPAEMVKIEDFTQGTARTLAERLLAGEGVDVVHDRKRFRS